MSRGNEHSVTRCTVAFYGGRCTRRAGHVGPHLHKPPAEAWDGNTLDLEGALIPVRDFNRRVREGRIDAKGNVIKKTPPNTEPPESA
jgi:hypothetical protein